jgi:hypothetical protein
MTKVRLEPWDDLEFVRTYERVAGELVLDGTGLHDPRTALEVQTRLRAAGYPNATCYCERTIDEALAHTARCIVSRDGAPSVKLGVARFVT